MTTGTEIIETVVQIVLISAVLGFTLAFLEAIFGLRK